MEVNCSKAAQICAGGSVVPSAGPVLLWCNSPPLLAAFTFSVQLVGIAVLSLLLEETRRSLQKELTGKHGSSGEGPGKLHGILRNANVVVAIGYSWKQMDL